MVESAGNAITIALLGPSFETDNRGVSALAECSIKTLLHRWPNADIVLLGGGRDEVEYTIRLEQRTISLKTIPIRFCANIFLSNHFLCYLFCGILFKMIPLHAFRRRCLAKNRSLQALWRIDLVADITGGDSFSDIYGVWWFLKGIFRKWLVLFYNKKLIMMPQTYGPFRKRISKWVARYILGKAIFVFVRDRESLTYLKKERILTPDNECIRLVPDVAFALDPMSPDFIEVEPREGLKKDGSSLIGLNVSGLLYFGGLSGRKRFGLQGDYRDLIHSILAYLMAQEQVRLLLIPHVFAPVGDPESDPEACEQLYETWSKQYEGRLIVLRGTYTHNEIKYIIGQCDFFLGSRMHACIGAMSQGIPTVGLAYSRKFQGVFESVDMGHCVADARLLDNHQMLEKIASLYKMRETLAEQLKQNMPGIRSGIETICEVLSV